jgi:hypothetical protein
VFRKLTSLVNSILALKIFFWAQPDAIKFIKGFIFAILFVLLVIYSHNQYLNWAILSNNKNFLAHSYIIKNLLIFVSLLFLFFYLKRKKNLSPLKKIKGEEKIYSENFKEDYFDKFREKKDLRSKADILLNKKINEKK